MRCWGSTDGVARYHFVKAGRLAKTEKLSPRCTWMACKETDTFTSRPETFIEVAGTTLKASMDILRKYGAAPEALLPFHIATNMYLGNENTFFATLATRRIAAYFNLQRNLTDWRSWLATHGPILVGVNVDATWDNATATHGKAVGNVCAVHCRSDCAGGCMRYVYRWRSFLCRGRKGSLHDAAADQTDNDRTAEVHIGGSVRINLAENATTGFRWAIDRYDEQLFEVVATVPHYPKETPLAPVETCRSPSGPRSPALERSC